MKVKVVSSNKPIKGHALNDVLSVIGHGKDWEVFIPYFDQKRIVAVNGAYSFEFTEFEGEKVILQGATNLVKFREEVKVKLDALEALRYLASDDWFLCGDNGVYVCKKGFHMLSYYWQMEFPMGSGE